MITILVVAHEGLAQEFLQVANTILNTAPAQVFCIAAHWGESKETIAAHIRHFFVDHPEDTVIFTDLFGSTHANLCLPYLQRGHVEMITGFNLPMLVKAMQCQISHTLPELVEKIVDYGQHHIYSAHAMMDPKEGNLHAGN